MNGRVENDWFVFSLKQMGDDESAKKRLEKMKEKLTITESSQNQYKAKFIAEEKLEIALVEEDIDKAMSHLAEFLDNRGIYSDGWDSFKKYIEYYKPLYAHKDWPKLYEKIQQRIKEEREIYLKLVADDKNAK